MYQPSLHNIDMNFHFCKVDSIFRDRSIGNHIKVETVKVMSLEGATFGYMRHGGSNKVFINLMSSVLLQLNTI